MIRPCANTGSHSTMYTEDATPISVVFAISSLFVSPGSISREHKETHLFITKT